MSKIDLLKTTPTVIEQEGNDTVIHIPAEIGGGTIREVDYQLSEVQIDTIRTAFGDLHQSYPKSLGLDQDSNEEVESADQDSPNLISDNRLETLWQQKDALRIIKPVFAIIESKQELGREVSEAESLALYRFNNINSNVNNRIAYFETEIGKIEIEDENERKQRIKDERDELERRKQTGAIYDDGSLTSPAVVARKINRRAWVLSGEVFTPEYRASTLGGITLDLLAGDEISDSIDEDDEIAAVACIDAVLSGKEVLDTDELQDLKSRANRKLNPSSHWAALESRRMSSKTARARLTTGDGQNITSRSKPGV